MPLTGRAQEFESEVANAHLFAINQDVGVWICCLEQGAEPHQVSFCGLLPYYCVRVAVMAPPSVQADKPPCRYLTARCQRTGPALEVGRTSGRGGGGREEGGEACSNLL